jgi:hypothetical protein
MSNRQGTRRDISARLNRWSAIVKRYIHLGYLDKDEIVSAAVLIQALEKLSKEMK